MSPTASIEQEYLTAADLQARFGWTKAKAYRVIAAAGCRPAPAGIPRAALERWLREHPATDREDDGDV